MSTNAIKRINHVKDPLVAALVMDVWQRLPKADILILTSLFKGNRIDDQASVATPELLIGLVHTMRLRGDHWSLAFNTAQLKQLSISDIRFVIAREFARIYLGIASPNPASPTGDAAETADETEAAKKVHAWGFKTDNKSLRGKGSMRRTA